MRGAMRRGRRLVGLGLLATGCQLAGVEPVAPGGAGGPDPVVAPGPIAASDEQAAADLYARAQSSFEARRFLEVLRLTDELVRRFPAADVSGAAVLLSARAEFEAGSVERADAAAERYIALLPAGDARAGPVRLFQAEILSGQPLIQLDRLLRIEPGAPPVVVASALALVRTRLDSLGVDELGIVADGAPRGGPAASPLYARLAAELLARGDDARAREMAAAAVAAGATGSDLTVAEGVMRGELPDGLRPSRAFSIATVLPVAGPPALADFSRLISEGIEVALATVLGAEYHVDVVARDDEGDPLVAAGIVSELEAEPVAGAIGFLLDDEMVSAASARVAGLPIVSPTARSVGLVGEGAYSLEGAQLQAARSIALHAASRAHQRVAMIYPDTPEAAEEADAFAATAAEFGIPIVGRFTYLSGATDFDPQFRQARNVLRAAEIAALGLTEADSLVHVAELVQPVGLFMPIPAEDVELVAPQFAYQGLDTLAIEVMGTSGWTDQQVLRRVDARLLAGVVATSPIAAGPGSAGYARFQQAYETYFQRSLVSPTPALGYDAALLLLEALRPGRLRPQDVQRAFEGLTDVEGATGVFSVVDRRIVRRTEVVRIERGRLLPMPGPALAPPAER